MIEEVKQLLEGTKKAPGLAAKLSDSANIVEDVGLDSLEMMDFMLEVEKRFQIELDFEQMEFDVFESIARFAQFVSRMKIGAKGRGDEADGNQP
jgi:acyl carrier protein